MKMIKQAPSGPLTGAHVLTDLHTPSLLSTSLFPANSSGTSDPGPDPSSPLSRVSWPSRSRISGPLLTHTLEQVTPDAPSLIPPLPKPSRA